MTPEERAELQRHEAEVAARFAALETDRDAARQQLAAFVPPGALAPGEIPALCGTCRDRSCVPGLPGCARCVGAEVQRLRATIAEDPDRAQLLHELDVQRAAMATMLADERQMAAARDQSRAERDAARAERDEAREQVTGMVRILHGLLRHADLADEVRIEIESALEGAKGGGAPC